MQLEIGLLSKVFPVIFMCYYTYFDTESWKELSQVTTRVNRFKKSFGSSILHHTVYSTGCYDKCFKNGEHQKLFQDTIYGAPYRVNKKYMVSYANDVLIT